MKKHVWLTILALVMMIILGSVITAQAEIIPPYGEGQIGLSAVVLCEDLTLRQAPGTNAGILEFRLIVPRPHRRSLSKCLKDFWAKRKQLPSGSAWGSDKSPVKGENL